MENFPQDFPQDFPARISHKIFLQDFPELDPDWLAPHHPNPNAKFSSITALINRPTYHKRSKVSPPTFPQILWEPQIKVYADSNEPAISQWNPTRPETNELKEHYSNVTLTQTQRMVLYPFSLLTEHPHRHNVSILTQTHMHTQTNSVNDALWIYIRNS